MVWVGRFFLLEKIVLGLANHHSVLTLVVVKTRIGAEIILIDEVQKSYLKYSCLGGQTLIEQKKERFFHSRKMSDLATI